MAVFQSVVAPSGAGAAQRAAFQGGNICVLDQLAAGALDASLGFCESCLVEITQRDDGTVDVTKASSGGAAVPLAHQFERDTEAQCPARSAPSPSDKVRADPRSAPAQLLASCVLIIQEGVDDGADRVLLTRRSAFMRTFPGAWVPPGGGVDPGERAAAAGAREVSEETGLEVDEADLAPLCVWESAYPESARRCADAGGLRRHHLVVYYTARLPRDARLQLPRHTLAEADAAVWLPLPREPAACLCADAVFDALGLEAGATLDARAPDGGRLCFDADELRGIWPQARGGGGVTRGALFALATLVQRGAVAATAAGGAVAAAAAGGAVAAAASAVAAARGGASGIAEDEDGVEPYRTCRDYAWPTEGWWDAGKGRVAFSHPEDGIEGDDVVCSMCWKGVEEYVPI